MPKLPTTYNDHRLEQAAYAGRVYVVLADSCTAALQTLLPDLLTRFLVQQQTGTAVLHSITLHCADAYTTTVGCYYRPQTQQKAQWVFRAQQHRSGAPWGGEYVAHTFYDGLRVLLLDHLVWAAAIPGPDLDQLKAMLR